MDIFIKEFPDCLKQVFVRISPEVVNSEFDKALTQLQKNFSFPGYRKGKVPIDIIEKNQPPELISLVSRSLVNKPFYELRERKIEIFSEPNITPLSPAPVRGKEFAFYMVIETPPKVIENIDPEKINAIYEEVAINDKMVMHFAKNKIGSLEEVSSKIEDNDIVTVNILNDGYSDEKEVIFETESIPDLKGRKKGDRISLGFSQLGNYVPRFLGKIKEPIEFEITKVERIGSGKLDDEAIKQSTPYKTADELKDAVKMELQATAASVNQNRMRKAVMQYIGKNAKVEFPKSIYIQNAAHHAEHFIKERFEVTEPSLYDIMSNEATTKDFVEFPVSIYEEIISVIAIDDIAHKNSITPDDGQVNYLASSRAKELGLSLDEYKTKSTREEWDSLMQKARREATIGFLMEKAKFSVKGSVPLIDLDKK